MDCFSDKRAVSLALRVFDGAAVAGNVVTDLLTNASISIALRSALDCAGDWAQMAVSDGPLQGIGTVGSKLVVGIPGIGTVTVANDVRALIFCLAFFQFEMIRAGFFVGGAIEIPKGARSFSASFARSGGEGAAVGRGQRRLPRLSLNSSVTSLFPVVAHGRSCFERGRDLGVLASDAHGDLFVDYLAPTIFAVGKNAGPFVQEMRMHRDAVAAKLDLFAAAPKMRSIYEWLALYHNDFCDACVRGFGLRIPDSRLQSETRARFHLVALP